MDFSIQIARKHTFPSAFRTSRYRLAGPRGQVLHATHRPAAGHSQKQNEIFPEFHSPRRILSFPAGIQSFSQVSIICQYSVPLTIFTCSFLLMIFLFCYFFCGNHSCGYRRSVLRGGNVKVKSRLFRQRQAPLQLLY